MRSGTTTSITRAVVALTGRREAYYTRLHRVAAGVRLEREVRLPLPGAVVRVAEASARDAGARSAGRRVRQLSRESRSGRQQRVRQAAASAVLAGTLSRADRADAARPGTPMLFQGQEFASSAPFLFFADHGESWERPLRRAGGEFLSQFPSITRSRGAGRLAAARRRGTFARCKLDLAERERHARRLRAPPRSPCAPADDPAIAAAAHGAHRRRGAIAAAIFVLRFGLAAATIDCWSSTSASRSACPRLPEPLLAPPFGCRWVLEWSSEAAATAGPGRAPFDPTAACGLPGRSGCSCSAPERPAASMTVNRWTD